MKKVLSLILTITIMFQVNGYASLKTETNKLAITLCDSREEFLLNLGVIDKEFLSKEYFTRSDIVKIISRNIVIWPYYCSYCSNNNCKYKLNNIYHDMQETRDDYQDFYKLYNCGGEQERITSHWVFLPIIQGSNNLMRPDDLITWSEFVTLCIRVLNWDVFIYLEQYENYPNIDMGYPDSYFDMAEKIGFSNIKKEGYVTTKDACDFLYELIQTPDVQYTGGFGIPKNVPYSQIHNDTYLVSRGYKICKMHINSRDEETKLKTKYSITDKINLLNRDVLIIYDERFTNTGTMILDDTFIFKGDENGLPKEMYGNIIRLKPE